MREKCLRPMIAIIAMTMIISAVGCANTTGFGKFVPDTQAKTAFEKFQISPEYRYYITGSDEYPVAIIALGKSYAMGNDLWKEIEPTPASMNHIVTNMQLKLMERCYQTQSGFLVLDPMGKQLGILYSYIGVGIAFSVGDDNIIRIYGPRDDDQLKAYQGRVQK